MSKRVTFVGDAACGVCADVKQTPQFREAQARGAVATASGEVPFEILDSQDPKAAPILEAVKAKLGKRYVPALAVQEGDCTRLVSLDDLLKGKPLPDTACEVKGDG